MALGKSVKSHRLGIPVLLASREIEKKHEQEAEVRTRKMKFHESVMMGNSPTKALSCDASSTTDITKELLQKCIDAGMDIRTISKAFSTSEHNMKYYQFRKFGVSIDKPSEVKIDEKIKPEPEVKEPGRADYEWSFYICDNDPDLPEMRILRSGMILVRKVKLDTESRYKIGFDKDLKRCRLIMSPQGQAPRASSLLPSYKIFVQQKHFEKVQSMITLPAIYRLNPDTLIGELVSITTER